MILKIILALLLINLAACASMQDVDMPAAGHIPEGISRGSEVELTTVSGIAHEFVVTEIDKQGLGGQPGYFEYQDIRELRVKVQQGVDAEIWAILAGIALLGLMAVGINAGAQAAGASSLLSGGG